MSYKVVLTKRANKDLQEVTNYYTEQSNEITKKFLKALFNDFNFLSENPNQRMPNCFFKS